MNFRQYLEVVKNRTPITTTKTLEIRHIDPEEDWDLAERVEVISNNVGIHFSRNKNITIVAMIGDHPEDVIGGVANCTYHADEGTTYDFDVVVNPQYQGFQNVGFKLINSAIQEAKNNEINIISSLVVNPMLAKILAIRYGFEGLNDSSYADYANRDSKPQPRRSFAVRMWKYI